MWALDLNIVMKKNILILAVLCGLASSASGGEFKPGQVPANTQWFLHVDVGGFKKTQIGKFVLEQAKEVAPVIDGLAGAFQFDPRKDLRGLTVFGTVVEGEPKGTVLVDGNFNQDHLLGLLKTNDTLKTEKVKGLEILSWKDEDKQSFGSFSGRNHLLVGDDRDLLVDALQVLSGKAPALKPGKLAGLARDPGNFFLLQAQVKGLPFPPEAKLLQHIQSVGLSLGEFGKNLVITLRVTASNEEVGTLIQKAVEGLAAIARLQMLDNEDPNLKEVDAILREVTIVKQKQTVVVRLSMPVEKILNLARDQLIDK